MMSEEITVEMANSLDNSSANIPFDWNNPDLFRLPDAISRPDRLDPQARRDMLTTLGNVRDGISSAEQSETLRAYRSLRPDQAALDLRERQNAEIERRLGNAFQTDPDLIRLAQNFDTMSDVEISRSLNKVLALQNEVLQGGGARSINHFRDRSAGAPRGEANAGMLGVNMIDAEGKRTPLPDLISTVLHENRHVHQHWLADNAHLIPDNDPRKSDAEIFKITFEIRRNNNSIGNGDFTYLDNPLEIDARNAEGPSRSPRLLGTLETHAAKGRQIIEENTRKILGEAPRTEIPADWDKIAATTPRVVPEPEDIWTKAARNAEAESNRTSQPSPESAETQERQRRFQEARAEWTQRPAQSDFASRYADAFNELASGRFIQTPPEVTIDLPASSGRLNLRSAFAEAGGRGTAMGMSAYGIVTKFTGADATYNDDVKAGGTRAAFANLSLASDVGGFGADAVESGANILRRAASVSSNLSNPQSLLSVSRMANILETTGGKVLVAGVKRAALPLALAAGAFELGAAVEARDPERAAGAVGSTFGGLLAGAGGGVALGAVGGSIGGPPGAAVGAVVGGVVGGIGGAIVGEKAAKATITNTMAGMMGEKPPNGEETTGYKVGKTIRPALQGVGAVFDVVKKNPVILATGPLAPGIAVGIAMAQSDTGKAVIRKTREVAGNAIDTGRQLLNRGGAALSSAKDSVVGFFSGKPATSPPAAPTIAQRLQPALDAMNKDASWVRHMDRNGDGKINQAELNRSLKQHGLTKFSQVDANHDGKVSAQELMRGVNKAIVEEKREIAIDRRGMDGMSADQLRNAIKADNILPDTMKIGGRNVDIREALKDQNVVKRYADQLETMHLRGDHDYSRQVAMLRELQERQSGKMVATQVPAPLMSLGQ